MTKALIVVDVQVDFCEGGALAVKGGNAVAERISHYIHVHGADYDKVAFTKDWHEPWPATNDGHFSEEPDFENSWPVHCEAGSNGSKFHPSIRFLYSGTEEAIFLKGYGSHSYSGFQGKTVTGISLQEWLSDIDNVDIVGIAGEFCVKQTAMDAVRNGLRWAILPEMVASLGGKDATTEVIKQVATFEYQWHLDKANADVVE